MSISTIYIDQVCLLALHVREKEHRALIFIFCGFICSFYASSVLFFPDKASSPANMYFILICRWLDFQGCSNISGFILHGNVGCFVVHIQKMAPSFSRVLITQFCRCSFYSQTMQKIFLAGSKCVLGIQAANYKTLHEFQHVASLIAPVYTHL